MLSFLDQSNRSSTLMHINSAFVFICLLFACLYADFSAATIAESGVNQTVIEQETKKKSTS